ncbi:hypothetical protein GCM10029976_028190 [Kribbella albertanoniae]|uniref:WD40 repeat domain-containing protein n=1 Tax=Kribbella albertanoniae TaxID=1266829 RepID=A0A4R4Q439_9ACTN|nr:hypothetical protein [Kribbella albertanoniae]TDC29659.1 hypothetical protein E1261_15190 [Kribbella albertanoniae]
MNDTESRLRDYLDTKAATVPANEQGPGLFAETTPRRPLWPMLATAASVAAVLALTVTVLTHLGPDNASPASPPAPLTDAAPKVPFSITGDAPNFKGSVHDGPRTVRLPEFITPVKARVGGGWLTEYYDQVDPGLDPHVGILKANGTFHRLGPKKALAAVLSPDGKQVAMSTYPTSTTTGIAVYDIASGTEVSSIASPGRMAGPMSWNTDGVWLDSGDPFSKDRLYVWKPGEPKAQPVQVPEGFEMTTTTPDSNIVVVSKGPARKVSGAGENFKKTTDPKPSDVCLQIGVLRDGAIDVQREHCDQGVQGPAAALSPDGAKVVNLTSKLTIDVATGKTTKLDLPDSIENWPAPVFEDATKLLVVTRPGIGEGPQRLHRCEVTTGECKLLRTEKDNQITLAAR